MRHPGPWRDVDTSSSDKIVDANGSMVVESMSGYEDSHLDFGSEEGEPTP